MVVHKTGNWTTVNTNTSGRGGTSCCRWRRPAGPGTAAACPAYQSKFVKVCQHNLKGNCWFCCAAWVWPAPQLTVRPAQPARRDTWSRAAPDRRPSRTGSRTAGSSTAVTTSTSIILSHSIQSPLRSKHSDPYCLKSRWSKRQSKCWLILCKIFWSKNCIFALLSSSP